MADSKQKSGVQVTEDEQQVLSLQDVTPKLTKAWFLYPHLLTLNFSLIGGLLAQVVSGYDGELCLVEYG